MTHAQHAQGELSAAGAASGWERDAAGVAYPPGPWALGARMLLTVFALREELVPSVLEAVMPSGTTLVRFGRHVLMGAAVVHYEPGVLRYDELLVAVLVRRGLVPHFTIPQIWVNSTVSRSGGRELWGIPKDLAAFELKRPAPGFRVHVAAAPQVLGDVAASQPDSLTVSTGPRIVAVNGQRSWPGLPRLPRLPLLIAQKKEQQTIISRSLVSGQLHCASARWTFSGPLGYLSEAKQLFSLELSEGSVVFGESVRRSAGSPARGAGQHSTGVGS